MKLTPLSIFFVNFANKICHVQCMWPLYNKKCIALGFIIMNFLLQSGHIQCIWQILLAKLTKNILRGINFTNLKTPGGYITKSKPQGVCLKLSQTLEVIMQFGLFFSFYLILIGWFLFRDLVWCVVIGLGLYLCYA